MFRIRHRIPSCEAVAPSLEPLPAGGCPEKIMWNCMLRLLRNSLLDIHQPPAAVLCIACHCGQARCSQTARMAAATGLHRQARLCAARPATFAPLSPCSSLPHALRSPCGLSARLVPGGPCPRPLHTLVPQQQQQQQHTPQQQSQLHQRHVCQAAAAALESAGVGTCWVTAVVE
jgi:hypothetical protein